MSRFTCIMSTSIREYLNAMKHSTELSLFTGTERRDIYEESIALNSLIFYG